jgi:NADPH:quinone reductase-like Zn-dependent oxidoreductase
LVTVDLAAKIPDNISTDEAASVPLGVATAFLGMYNKKKETMGGGAELVTFWENPNSYAGQPFVVFGGSTSVGQYGENTVCVVACNR